MEKLGLNVLTFPPSNKRSPAGYREREEGEQEGVREVVVGGLEQSYPDYTLTIDNVFYVCVYKKNG